MFNPLNNLNLLRISKNNPIVVSTILHHFPKERHSEQVKDFKYLICAQSIIPIKIN